MHKMEVVFVLLLSYVVFAESVHVVNQGTRNVTLEEGQHVELNITGNFSDYLDKSCIMTCRIVEREPILSHYCKVHSTNIFAVVKSTSASKGLWNCTVELKQEQQTIPGQQNANRAPSSPIFVTLNISEKEKAVLGLSSDTIIIIAIAVSTIVVLIIVGQTICIIHFKKKAKRAQIDKNLTPKNTINEGSSTDRYVNKKTGKGEVDEGIYEALESARDEPPPLPPLATIPVTPKPQHLMRSASQSNLLDGAKSSTTPRPPRSHQSPGRFNTVARSSSLERIKKRPPQPLPTESDIYEDVALDDVSPVTKRKLLSMKSTPPEPTTPMGPNRPLPGKPLPGFLIKPEFLKLPGPNAGRPPIANKFPAAAKPMGGMPMPTLPSMISGAKPIPGMPGTSGPGGMPMGGMPLLPSMLSAANLKPLNKTKPKPPPPVTERPRLPTPSSSSAKPFKPKPPVPLPEPVRQEPERIPEDFESVISDDSDDEFKCYDVLPDFNIYGNGAY